MTFDWHGQAIRIRVEAMRVQIPFAVRAHWFGTSIDGFIKKADATGKVRTIPILHVREWRGFTDETDGLNVPLGLKGLR